MITNTGKCRLGCLAVAFWSLIFAGCSPPSASHTPAVGPPQRIVSLSPAITEILFAVGCGDRVVGVTSFCKYPPAAALLPKVGGFYDTNYELVFSLQPDLVLHTIEHDAAAQNLQTLHLAHQALSCLTLPDIMASIRRTGALCHATAAADAVVDGIQTRMKTIRSRIPADAPAPSVLITIGRDPNDGDLGSVFLAGPSTIYGEMLQLLGARNVYQGQLAYAQIGREGIVRMNPDVIIDLAPDLNADDLDAQARLRADWEELPSVTAVKQRRINVLTGDYVCIPGPRIAQTMADIALAIYPALVLEEAP